MQPHTTSSRALPHVSVVIPAYNEEKYLPLCLESVKNQDYAGECEIIVVDNASTDDTAKIALDQGAKVVYESKRSPAHARQKGAKVATGEIIAFIDADTQAPICWLSVIVSRFVRERDIVVVSGPYAFFDAGRVARRGDLGLQLRSAPLGTISCGRLRHEHKVLWRRL